MSGLAMIASQALSPDRSPATEPMLVVHAGASLQPQKLQESDKPVDLNPCFVLGWCSDSKEIKRRSSLTRSRMSTMATEASFEADHCDFMDSHSCKSHKDEPEELGDNDDKSSTNEGSFVPHACGTEASEDASELAEWFDSLAPSSVAGNSASYSRSFLLSVNANLRRQMQQTSVPPLDSLTLPKMLPVRVKCPSRSIESSETKAILQGHRSSGSPTEAASRRVRQGIMCEQTEPSMIVDSSKQSTIMLRNIPNRCNRASITQQLEAHGFGGAYDLVYVPIDKTVGNLNLGYAFVNFREEEDCSRFREAFNGKRAKVLFPNSCSEKVLMIVPASVQGRDAYLKRLSSFVWPVGSDVWQPLIFDDSGERIKLPVGRTEMKDVETAAACKEKTSFLSAKASEVVPTAAFPKNVDTDCDEGGVLDNILMPLCNAKLRGATRLGTPRLCPA
mmetsp:Transcript_134520/g.261953  ORF Transcript_134520/g.261953 Transcript_134520/m.261953 type:complete len:447 (-) Transcript_134520:330-1670(-)